MKTKTSLNKAPSLETKNRCGKTVDKNTPYERWRSHDGNWEWRVLKKWQSPAKEVNNPYARWFCAVQTPYTAPGYDMGDVYISEIHQLAYKVADTQPIEQW